MTSTVDRPVVDSRRRRRPLLTAVGIVLVVAGLAGHRTSHGKPLREVHRLQAGDAVVVESEDAWLVYRMVARDIVTPHQSKVLKPIPPFDGAHQSRYLTLTTCDPIYGITDRFIVWAEADYWTPKTEGLPPDLG